MGGSCSRRSGGSIENEEEYIFKDDVDIRNLISPHSLKALLKFRSKFAHGWKELGILKKRNLSIQGPVLRWEYMVERRWKMKEHDFKSRTLKDLKDERGYLGLKDC